MALKGIEKDLPLTEAIFYILLALRHPNHGYGIIQEVESMTSGRLVMGAGTLYGAIQNLEKKKWIQVYDAEAGARGKKQYLITDAGREVFEAERLRLTELIKNAELINGEN